MNSKITQIIVVVLICFGLVSFANCDTTKKDNQRITPVKQSKGGAMAYQKNFKQFTYYIETIGTVSIDKVELDNGTLRALYSYQYGNELRNVVSTLKLDDDGIYKGICSTTVNNKKLFDVGTWLTFNPDGTATGNWSMSGTPSKNDPQVTITK